MKAGKPLMVIPLAVVAVIVGGNGLLWAIPGINVG
jgi:nitrogen fixation-related uncharacterized protein